MADELNPSQRQHLLSSCEYADKLLSDMEAILQAGSSSSPFPKYSGGLMPAQARVVEDYIARIRAQIVAGLRSQGIEIPAPNFRVLASLRVTLLFAEIAFEDCTADKMRGYGPVAPGVVRDLNGLVGEIKALIEALNGYLGLDLDRDPAERLRRLSHVGDEARLLAALERVIAAHGLVDYRVRLNAILDRMEAPRFEVALFGRVSSGKSSLLNHVLGAELLPVGVNPITAVPTRIVYGAEPRLQVTIADRAAEVTSIAQLAEFVTEEHNPGNRRRVERLLIEYPSERLRQGVVLVDTPGLGSLAGAGAAETLAYLPNCDLGIVLIDAGSTLTGEDIATLHALLQAGIESLVLLSKADLLAPPDRERSLAYIREQVRARLGLDPPAHAVSIAPGCVGLLDDWFRDELAPRFERHQELTREALRRKTGALRDAIAGTLQARLQRALRETPDAQPQNDPQTESALQRLRRAAGGMEETRAQCAREAESLRGFAPALMREAARRIAAAWRDDAHSIVDWDGFVRLASLLSAERADAVRRALEALADALDETLRSVAAQVDSRGATPEELRDAVRDMPRLDLGPGVLDLRRPWVGKLSAAWAQREVETQLRERAGEALQDALGRFSGMLETWSRRVLAELQMRFNSYADAYRERLGPAQPAGGGAASLREALREIDVSEEPSDAHPTPQPAR